MSEKIKSANSVVVVGGGVVGVEMAAEVRCAFPDVTVRLVTNGASLITDKPPALGAKCAAWLEKNNVELIYNNRVVPGEGDFVTLTNIDQNIEADVVLWYVAPHAYLDSLCGANIQSSLNHHHKSLLRASTTILCR